MSDGYETKNYLADNDDDISNLFSNDSQKIKNITFFIEDSETHIIVVEDDFFD